MCLDRIRERGSGAAFGEVLHMNGWELRLLWITSDLLGNSGTAIGRIIAYESAVLLGGASRYRSWLRFTLLAITSLSLLAVGPRANVTPHGTLLIQSLTSSQVISGLVSMNLRTTDSVYFPRSLMASETSAIS